MATSCVRVLSDVYMVCLSHALSTEKQEVMGLLIGEIDEKRISHVSAVIMLRRSDKRKDRVEISPEQLSYASTQAERLALVLGRPMRVLGWYHSHPHITVWPSHVGSYGLDYLTAWDDFMAVGTPFTHIRSSETVNELETQATAASFWIADVQTQAMYQMMDEGFIGLIFSVFSEDSATKHGRIQVTCFQSINQSPEGEPPQYMRLEIPIHVIPSTHLSGPCLNSLVQLPRILCEEEQDAYSLTCQIPDLDLLTRLHNGAVFTKSLCHIAEVVSGPLLQTLESRLQQNKIKLKALENTKNDVLAKLQQIYKTEPQWQDMR